MTKYAKLHLETALTDTASKPVIWTHDRTSIIIPCYNEANRLHLEVFLNFARQNPKISFVFVDDGSKDLTISLLCGAMAALPSQVDVLTMARNAGKAEAIRHGLKFAAKRGEDSLGWRTWLQQVRAIAVGMARKGELVIYRKGKPVDPNDFRGVYRLGLPRSD